MGIARDGYFWRRGNWVEAIVASWLQQTQPDLNSTDQLAFADFGIGVFARDLDAYGQSEYILDVVKGQLTERHVCPQQAEYVNYLVVRHTDNGYQWVEAPLSWKGYGDYQSGFGDEGQVEVAFEDSNADGLPEWWVLEGGSTTGGPQSGYERRGRLYILGWRDGAMVDLAQIGDEHTFSGSVTAYGEEAAVRCNSVLPRQVTWETRVVADDAAAQILQHQRYEDNWGCVVRVTKLIAWNAIADRYEQLDERRTFFANLRHCAWRQAEEAMWAGDYQQALGHYTRALTLPPRDEAHEHVDINRRRVYEQYHTGRMALAYQLVGQPARARAILETLHEQTFAHEPVQTFVLALAAAPDEPIAACLAAYRAFAQQVTLYSP